MTGSKSCRDSTLIKKEEKLVLRAEFLDCEWCYVRIYVVRVYFVMACIKSSLYSFIICLIHFTFSFFSFLKCHNWRKSCLTLSILLSGISISRLYMCFD